MNKILLSVVTPTLNNEKDISYFLNTVLNQNFPQNNLEIIISDGGSKDHTKQIAKSLGAVVINNPDVLPDPGVRTGIEKAKGEFVIVLACDNIFKDKEAFNKMLAPFKNKYIAAAFPMQCSTKSDSIYTKYINNFTDPFNHYVYGYSANGRTFKKAYKSQISNNIYDVYDFKSNNDVPLIAFAQGFMVRKKIKRGREDNFDDVMPVVNLIRNNHKIAYVHSARLFHHTVKNTQHFMRKQTWATINALKKKKFGISHRLEYLSDSQKLRFKIWPIYSISFILPSINAIYHYIIDKDSLWIFHPFLCMISALSSIWGFLLYHYNNKYEFKR